MRGIIAFQLALSCISTTAALPHLNQRTPADAAKKPSYSVVPLEPGNSPGNGNGGNGGGGGDGDDPVTVVKTVVKTQTEAPATVTLTEQPTTVTKQIPTTVISIVDIQGDPTTTVTVTPTLAPTTSTSFKPSISSATQSANKTTIRTTPTSFLATSTQRPITVSSLPGNSTHPISISTSTVTVIEGLPSTTMTQTPSFTTSFTPSSSSSKTYDDGMWHTTYPPWNATTIRRFR